MDSWDFDENTAVPKYASPQHLVWKEVKQVRPSGLGLMRFKSVENTVYASPPKKKLRVDHTTSPDFHQTRETHVAAYELYIGMPPAIKRVSFQASPTRDEKACEAREACESNK